MGLFSRGKEAADVLRVDDVPFDALRRPSRATRKPRDSNDPPPPLDPAEAAKSRARHRLIGAVALALAAIVFVPMLFDRTPVATTDDISLQIPDRDSPFEGRRGVPDPSRGPLKASSELPIVPPPPNPTVATQPAPTVESSVAPVVRDAKPAEATGVLTSAEKSVPTKAAPEKVAEKPAEKPAEKANAVAQPADDPKALAALEGKGAAAPPSESKSYAVQIAAFSAADKARGLRDQLAANGMKAYVESVSTTQGLRTRVRLGPFATREAAETAKQKLKTMKLDGSVVPL